MQRIAAERLLRSHGWQWHLDVAEILGHLKGLQQVGVVLDDRDRLVVLRAGQQGGGGADFVGGQLPHLGPVLHQGGVQLLEAAHPQFDVGGPVGVVEGPARRGNGRLGIGHRRIGRVAENLSGGRVQAGEGAPVGSLGERTVDEHAAIGRRNGRAGVGDGVGGCHPNLLVKIVKIAITGFSSAANRTFNRREL